MASNLVYLGAILLFIGTASALKCYACNGFTCGYNWLKFVHSEVECGSKDGTALGYISSVIPTHQCVKIEGKDEKGSSFTVRNCTTYTGSFLCSAALKAFDLTTGSNDQDIKCHACTEDLCNSAPKFSGMMFMGLVLACLAFLF